ncbi:BamA/TamA family outer membrane protein [Psychroflexus halocasei]|uniref:Surface antigen n=1 Tax=Psychroflexus halocasei TaxID=908615 RepID=A0A1H3YAI4_9FLAO|nr:BamA/TamA family outer membrane protein [Psychroflexus halocasei]SEA07898.1 Surface antigen [Psychroflexus halocasei]
MIVPRDRDMAMNVTHGLLVSFGKYFFLKPHVYGFKGNLKGQINQYLYKSDFLNAHPSNQMNYEHYKNIVEEVQKSVTDSVLTAAVNAMPKELDAELQEKTFQDLKIRRDQLSEAMDTYYNFSNRIVDIRGTNSKEFVSIKSLDERDALHVEMRKINKHGKIRHQLMSKTYPKSTTKEIRLYLEGDRDSVVIDNKNSTIKLRIIGGESKDDRHKSYVVKNSKKKVRIYDYETENYEGLTNRLKIKTSKDSTHTAFKPVNLYHDWIPAATAGYNRDNGLIFGLGVKFIQQAGFRKEPYTAMHKLMLSYAFSTKAYGIQYNAEWIDLFGKANFLIDTDVRAPENTDNFFGIGNTVAYDKNHHYFKANYNLYKLKTSLKWETHLGGSFSFGPAFQYYHYNPNKNNDRFIEDGVINYTYDRDIIDQDKYHIGLVADYEIDKRNDDLLPTKGIYLHSELSGWKGVNSYSKDYLKFKGEFSFHKNLNASETLVLSNRIGGEITAGDPTFYQHAYLGGKGNLLGYRQNRFAGEHSVYNNLEMRLAIADFGNLFFKGQLGLTGFYDIGRVWVDGEQSHKWHDGVGGGIYFAPAYSLLLNFQMGYADEGWYPYFSLGLRF